MVLKQPRGQKRIFWAFGKGNFQGFFPIFEWPNRNDLLEK